MDDNSFIQISEEQQEFAEKEIKENQRIMDYEIREFPIEVILHKFLTGLEADDAELYIPDYQREESWNLKQKCRFIESLLINLPIPYLFVADTASGEREGKLEIVDGTQRIRTLVQFTQNEFQLENLKLLPSLNTFSYKDLPKKRQMRFLRKTLRLIELTEKSDENSRRELFDRLNSGGTKLRTMEIRKGTQDGEFYHFIDQLADNKKYKELCPISKKKEKHQEGQELLLRFFAYLESYDKFEKSVDEFLTDYLESKNKEDPKSYKILEDEFNRMLSFIEKTIPYGFRKTPNSNSVPRIRFEALAIGVALALREIPNLTPPKNISDLLESKDFLYHTRSDASNSRPRVKGRLFFVKNFMLGEDTSAYARPVSIKDQQTFSFFK